MWKGAYNVLGGGEPREGENFKNIGADGKIILEWICKKSDRKAWTALTGSGYGQVADNCECGNGPLGSIKSEEILDWPSTC